MIRDEHRVCAPHRSTRRRFLQTLATAPTLLAVPIVAPASILAQGARPAPSERIVLAAIGVGSRGVRNLESFLGESDCQVMAVCDVDKLHAEEGKELVNRHYKNQDCRVYYDFRHLLARADLDAVALALPNHWHAVPAIQAVKAGLDVYSEAPLAHTLREGRAICEAVRRYGCIWQTGSWQRSVETFRTAAQLVRNGRIGKVRAVEVGVPSGHPDLCGTAGQEQAGPPPTHLDYEFWLGPAPWAPYCPARVHQNWRWHLDYGGGQLLEWVGHHVDIAHWGMDWDATGPVEVEAAGEFPSRGLWNTATAFRVTCKYANEVSMLIAAGAPQVRIGTRWIGEDGWIWCDRETIEAEPKRLLLEPTDAMKIKLPGSPGHHRNFLDCVKSRRAPVAPAEVGQRSMTPGHLGQIAMQLRRKLSWNPETETIADDPTASRLLGTAMREPWRLG
ncbi:MAG: Gfo/Idh/MocA family oxidoreductase [Verrucomicrobia bacterium]|nr:Gfo/Idh/MocA family oxidoreductase [Verrucomicrobiota bacterium]MDI9382289.1 Gfo/Idh/MocA family oxidoreductase [Verrucomicrobiota bacterium]NMD20144.1 Gfo/Idh/MocA family oxidoreductase [Verrucomicrobiota bacterium]HOA60546.1 Gfo/Idh/MocA family oxidoreductase [Verrucomicrobiota bacterium]HOG86587.1 Gfo/Idh/MocA family oxidoreductase [Verrucomicrobiota bacterium]